MDDATYVIFASGSRRAKLRAQLKAQFAEGVNLAERRRLFGSEFVIRARPALAREAHQSLIAWLDRP